MIAGGLSFISRSEDSIPSDAFDVCRMEAVPGRSNDLLSSEKRCNIAAREAPRAEGFEPSVVPCVVSTHLPSPDGSKVYLCPTNRCLSDKGPSLRGRVPLPSRAPLNLEQHKERKASYKYSFRLDEQQNIRFCRMLAEAGLEHNRSRFIVKRIFAEEFRVVRIDPTLGRYVTRLNQFYEQIQRVGNNYNQIVRAVNTHFSHTAIPRQVLLLERRTRELKALSEQVIALSRELYELWSRECE